jgi:hypothetical protein
MNVIACYVETYNNIIMNKDTLFNEPELLYDKVKINEIPLYQYMNSSDKEHVKLIRSKWNEIYKNCTLSKNIKDQLRINFQSCDDSKHISALFELFVYEFFKRIGYKVTSAPTFKSGKPDFKIISTQGIEFCVEATCILSNILPDKQQYLIGQVTDTINKIESSRFRVIVKIRGKLYGELKKRKFLNEVKEWFETLNYQDVLSEQIINNCSSNKFTGKFQVSGANVFVTPIALKNFRSSRKFGLIRLYPVKGAQRVITDILVRKKLKKKIVQIKDVNLTTIVAINVMEEIVDEKDVLDALFGDVIPTNDIASNCNGFKRGTDGAWIFNNKPRNKKIEGVLIFNCVDHDCIPSQKPKMIINPFIKNNSILLDIPYVNYYLPHINLMSLKALNEKTKNFNAPDNHWRIDWPF